MNGGPALLSILEKLIAFDTVSARGNLHLIEFIKDYIAGYGIAAQLVPAPDGQAKANLWATIGPSGVQGGVVLSGHTDVVPVDGQPWSSNPFRLRDAGDRYFGRGTADMKSFIALALYLIPQMLERPLQTPIHFAFSYDEEVGCLGVPHLLSKIGQQFPKPRIAIIGEPTEMRLATRHKGISTFRTIVTGQDAHSSQPQLGVNAITAGAEIVGYLAELAEALSRDGPFDRTFDPSCATVNVGNIHGGTAINIIARQCTIEWDFRPIPGMDAEHILRPLEAFTTGALLPRLQQKAKEASIETRLLTTVPPLNEEKDGAAETLVKMLSGINQTFGMAYATEAGQFQKTGISAVVCGPGSIAQAHQPDEYITKEQLLAGEAFLRRLVAWAQQDHL